MCKIKIVHVIGNLTLGGAERFVIDLCNELSKSEKNDVWLVSLSDHSGTDHFSKEIDKKVSYVSFGKQPGFSLAVLIRLTTWLKNLNPHIVHSHLNAFEYLMPIGLFSTAAFFHTIHNIAQVECPGYLAKSLRKLFYFFRKVRAVTISINGSYTYHEYYGLENEVLIENGRHEPVVTNEDILPGEKTSAGSVAPILLLHVGRISVEKNQMLLIKAVQAFNKTEKEQCRLLLIGQVQDEPLYDNLKNQVGSDANIVFLGGRKDVADFLRIADFFCLSSVYEGMPISLIESFAMGCIPICTPVGGIPEMIKEGVNGFLSENLTVSAYRDVLKKAVYHPDKDAIRAQGKAEFSSRYHIRISAQAHLLVYEKALGKSAQATDQLDYYTY
ncbi:Glycosyl transferase, group 1 [Pedobacter sp. BAL39]|uniref:glycosyltransferase family 4 protein n=1 Tax=Pedobacter sp. BAL39 TaxID=391596 RepID=UPI0001559B8A|nr:glycosyltransferase family 4 protein [Pedobacter sp. BAL39]EDM38335.1 Glycosyl transferase, group 1 [Pedobacter sp. BAL39]